MRVCEQCHLPLAQVTFNKHKITLILKHAQKESMMLTMLWILAFHIISVVCWFAGLFYLPRLYVYHAATTEKAVREQLKIMEHKLYYYITTPAMILTVFFGLCLWLPHYNTYRHAVWLHFKIPLVLALIVYHIYCGVILKQFRSNTNVRSHKFYRFFNEIPTIVLISVVILSVLKP